MDVIVIFIALSMIISKFLDCHSTVKGLSRYSETAEQNKLAQKLMLMIGQHAAVWSLFFLAVAIIAFSTWLLYNFYPAPGYKMAYIIFGLFITAVQLAVAVSNYSQKSNLITRVITYFPLYRNWKNN